MKKIILLSATALMMASAGHACDIGKAYTAIDSAAKKGHKTLDKKAQGFLKGCNGQKIASLKSDLNKNGKKLLEDYLKSQKPKPASKPESDVIKLNIKQIVALAEILIHDKNIPEKTKQDLERIITQYSNADDNTVTASGTYNTKTGQFKFTGGCTVSEREDFCLKVDMHFTVNFKGQDKKIVDKAAKKLEAAAKPKK